MVVYIPFYSRYGNVEALAVAVAEGVDSVEGCEAVLAYTRDTVTPPAVIDADQVWRSTYARLCETYPAADHHALADADAVILGSPTRFGNMAAQLKALIDATAGIWIEGALIGKVGAAFTATASLHGGQETTLLSMYLPMIHHGMLIVGIPYSEAELADTTSGGTPYGPTAVVGPMADRPPTETDLILARKLGKRVAELARKLRG